MDFGFAGEATPRAKAYTQWLDDGAKLRNRVIDTAGHHAGKPFRAVGRGVGYGLGGAAKVTGRLAAGAGKAMVGIAARAPLATGLGIASLGMIPSQLGGPASAAKRQASAAMGRQAQHFMKASHVNTISPEDLRTHLAVCAQLEKQASRKLRPLDQIYRRFDQAARNGGSGFKRVVDHAADAAGDASEAAAKGGKEARKSLGDQRIGGKDGYRYRDLVGAGLLLGGGAAVAGLGGDRVGKGMGEAGDLVHRMGRNRHYNAMIKADPELKQYNPAEVEKVFGVIHRSSPYVSKEPLLAASTVRSILDTPRASHTSRTPVISVDAVKRVLDLESGRQGTRYPFMQEVKGRPEADLRGAANIIG